MRKVSWFALIWLLACGDDDGTEPPGSSASATCERGCARAASANCPGQPSDCTQRCEADISATPAGCLAAVNAYASCIGTAVFSCDNTGVAEATSCRAELSAWVTCAGGAPLDAGVPDATLPMRDSAGATLPDTSTPGQVDTGVQPTPDASMPLACSPAADDDVCNTCLKTSCCESVTACTGDCLSLLECFNACLDDDCYDGCAALYSDGASGVEAIYDCTAIECAVPCEV